jgi:tetratricopeptide (TPR) repeat protein
MSKQPLRPSSAPGNAALQRAVLALQMQRPEEAEQLAAGVVKANRGNIFAAQILGRALVMQDRAAEAIVPLERAARRSGDPAIETDLAVALTAAGRSEEALDQLRRTATRKPPFLPAVLEYGGQLASAGRFDEAIAAFESGIAFAPAAIDLRMALAFALIKRNSRVRAREILSQTLTMAPERPDVLSALARVMAQDGEYAAAADLFRQALRLRPDDLPTRNHLGACLLEMGEREAGETSLRAVLREAPQLAGQAITALAGASHGRFFLRPSDAAKFLRIDGA